MSNIEMEEMKMEEEILKKNNSDCHLELGDHC